MTATLLSNARCANLLSAATNLPYLDAKSEPDVSLNAELHAVHRESGEVIDKVGDEVILGLAGDLRKFTVVQFTAQG